MEHGGTHVGQLPQFGIGDVGNLLGIGHDSGIGHEKAGNVGPVFIHIGMQSVGQDGTGDVAAASGEHLDLVG